ncbi:Hypothetical predicted protein [Lecanosticta acicola]|uniref:Uncharacterized protein n=1 Tax=Lecanosticta acicola TaxID=111012 RepID=A0AAI8Z2R8_9PEZI|nr:Hypothetical predicted protein [Lecanosticta acicola]
MLSLQFVAIVMAAVLSQASPLALPGNDTTLKERQFECAAWSRVLEAVGDGDPHQVWFDKQVSETVTCSPDPEDDCQSGVGKEWSVTLEADLGLASEESWINGGFSVAYTWGSSSSEVCGSHSAGRNVCIWYSQAFTAYTVQAFESNACTGRRKVGDPFVITSPNKDNVGGEGFYCVVGTCRTNGQGYWHGSVPGGDRIGPYISS